MKILHIDTRPDWRGGQFLVLLTMRGQHARGQDVQLMALKDSLLAKRAAAEGIPVHFIPSLLLRIRGALCLREILDQQHFEIVHTHDPHALTVAWLARAHLRSAIVISRRLALPPRRGLGLARYLAARRVIAVSQFVAQTVIDSGVPADRVAVVPDGVEIPPEVHPEARREARKKWGNPSDVILLGCVGYLVSGKRQDVALRAFALVLRDFPNCKLLIVGDGPDRAGLEALAAELRITHAVVFTGFIEDVESVFRALDIFIFPAVGEALPTSLLLAMAYGLPCIASASGGVPEMIESEKDGILIAAAEARSLKEAIEVEIKGDSTDSAKAATERTAAEFASALIRLLADRRSAQQIGKAARQTIEKRFTLDALSEATLQVYKSILSDS